jgi:hypothetical protein
MFSHRPKRHGAAFRISIACSLAAAVSLVAGVPVLAAIVATLSASQANPGELVVLTTDNLGQGGLYDALASEGRQPVYLASTIEVNNEVADHGGLVCGASKQHYLGRLTWSGDVGSLSFRVPDVPKGDYYFLIAVRRGCWRMGPPSPSPSATFTLTVGAARATPSSPQSRSGNATLPLTRSSDALGGPMQRLAAVCVALAMALTAGCTVIIRRVRRSRRGPVRP